MSLLKRITKGTPQVAERALKKGDLSGAIAALEDASKRAPNDLKCRRQLADVYVKAGRFQDATKTFHALAEVFAAEGLRLKAISACKAVLELDEDHEGAKETLARLSEQSGSGLYQPGPPLVPALPDDHDDEVLEADDVAEIELDAHDADELIVAETASESGDDERELDRGFLPGLPLFSSLPQHAVEELLSDLDEWRVPANAVIVRQGEIGHSVFVIASGEARVERDGRVLATLTRGELFGEMAMLSSHPRTASVVATEESELFEIQRARMDHIMGRYASVEGVLLRFCRERLLGDVLRSSLFTDLDERLVREMVRAFRTRRVPMGQRVVAQGTKGRGLYVVLSGDLDVARERDGKVRTVSQLSAGDVFGEMSLLHGEPTSASVTALTSTTLLALSRKGFTDFCKRHPVMKKRLAAIAGSRRG